VYSAFAGQNAFSRIACSRDGIGHKQYGLNSYFDKMDKFVDTFREDFDSIYDKLKTLLRGIEFLEG